MPRRPDVEIPCVLCGAEAIINVGDRWTCEHCFVRLPDGTRAVDMKRREKTEKRP